MGSRPLTWETRLLRKLTCWLQKEPTDYQLSQMRQAMCSQWTILKLEREIK